MRTSAALRRLEAAGLFEVVEALPVPGGRLVEPLADRSARCFGALRRRDLLDALAFLEGRSEEENALRGRLRWLLGEGTIDGAGRSPRALACAGAALTGRDPLMAVSLLERAARGAPDWPWVHLWLAAARLHSQTRGECRKALADLDRFEPFMAAPASALIWRSLAHLRLGEFRAARESASKLIALEPDRCAGWALRSAARMALGEREGGIDDFHESKEREPNGGFNPVESLIGGNGRNGDRRARLDAAIKRAPKEALLLVERAELLRESGQSRFDLALADYERAAELEPGRAWIAAQMSRAEAPQRGSEAALKRLDRAVKLAPRSGWIRAWRGENLRQLKRLPQALRDLDAGIALMPWYGYAHAWRGAALAARGRWPAALASLDAAVMMEPTFPTSALALAARGRTKRALRDFAGAVDDMTAAFLQDHKHEWVPSRAATEEDWRRGESALDEALKSRPRHSWSLAWRGWVRLHRGKTRQALEDLTTAARAGGAWPLAWRALTERGLGRAEAAERDLRAALKREPGNALAARLLAESEYAAGRYARALRLLSSCGGEAALTASFYRLRAAILEKVGRWQECREDRARAQSLDPSGS